ncbi:hypothetical protein [Microbacterium telephonicum]|uniref:Phage integrase family protein n=1 Tax=Microbacterium telephonicum TaxID=1714841 RepID=A0A498C127_9MICO|nr:hypothetical protein [Microbacterium telephonicum]RLK49325.1 hypothetical protein C7474_1468 [Microbacterium telephonicum]
MSTRSIRRTLQPTREVYVLRGRPLRNGQLLTTTARYGDENWDLAPAAIQKQERGFTIRFATVPEAYRATHRLLMFSMLSGSLPPGEDRPSISTVVTTHYNLNVFYRWLDHHHGGRPISTVTLETLESYQRHLLLKHSASPGRRHALRSAVAYLWRFRVSLGSASLALNPHKLAAWSEPHQPPRENSTARIPEQVHSRLLVWALRFVDDFAEDILDAITRWEELRETPSRPAAAYGSAQTMLTRYLDAAVGANTALPGYNGVVNLAAISRASGVQRKAVEQYVALVHRAAARVGVSDFTYLGVDVRGKLDGTPWIEGVSLDPARDDSISELTQVLQAACYILVAFLSGMRDSEVKHLRRGACEVRLDGTGAPYRWLVNSLAFKGESEVEGVPATWVVGEPAARALRVLERIQDTRARGRNEWLFGPIKSGPGAGSAGRGGNVAMTVAGTNRQLNRFIRWVNDYCAARRRSDGIPDVDGRPWNLTTRQFRRTLAWYIARRPGGSIAGAIAYRHHSIQMFEGYAGTSESGFRAEVEAEEALARGEALQVMIDQHEHVDFGGPAGPELHSRLSSLAHGGFSGQVTTDRRRLLRLVSVNGAEIYKGKYVICAFKREKALCLLDREDASGPNLGKCQPLACGNVALDSDNRAVWRGEVADLERQLVASDSLPPALAARLRKRRERVLRLLGDEYRKEPR